MGIKASVIAGIGTMSIMSSVIAYIGIMFEISRIPAGWGKVMCTMSRIIARVIAHISTMSTMSKVIAHVGTICVISSVVTYIGTMSTVSKVPEDGTCRVSMSCRAGEICCARSLAWIRAGWRIMCSVRSIISVIGTMSAVSKIP